MKNMCSLECEETHSQISNFWGKNIAEWKLIRDFSGII